jgi:hypothetical protein
MKIILRLFYFYIIDNSLCFCFIHNSAANITKQDVVTNGSTPLGWRGRHWNALEYPGRVFATGLTGGLRPINTAYLPTVDSVVENIVSHLQHRNSSKKNRCY